MNFRREEQIRDNAINDAQNSNGWASNRPSDYEGRMIYDRAFEDAQEANRSDEEIDAEVAEEMEMHDANAKGVMFIAMAIGLLFFSILAQGALVGYSVNYTPFVIIGFILTGVFMYMANGSNAFLNGLFYVGCFAIATRFFAVIVEYYEGVPYVNYIMADTTHLGDLIKYTLFYFVYICLVPYGLMKLVTMMVREFKTPKQQEKKLNI
ncbi:hypothetical protein C1N73_28540 (plasmid) [Priestia aryabhattai]